MDWKLHEIVVTRDGNIRKRLVGGVPFRTREEAARYAADLVKTYPKNGYDERRLSWWAEDRLGSKIQFVIAHEASLDEPQQRINAVPWFEIYASIRIGNCEIWLG